MGICCCGHDHIDGNAFSWECWCGCSQHEPLDPPSVYKTGWADFGWEAHAFRYIPPGTAIDKAVWR